MGFEAFIALCDDVLKAFSHLLLTSELRLLTYSLIFYFRASYDVVIWHDMITVTKQSYFCNPELSRLILYSWLYVKL